MTSTLFAQQPATQSLSIQQLSDTCLQVQDSYPVSAERHQWLAALCQQLTVLLTPALTDAVLSYSSITLHFSFNESLNRHKNKIMNLLSNIERNKINIVIEAHQNNTHVIPVYYGKEVALDKSLLQQRTGLTWEVIIGLHSGCTHKGKPKTYRAYASGFTPGFAYLGQLVPPLFTERLATPRLKIPAGSVAIAADQTAIYPSESPGGWLIIGKTPISLLKKPVDILIHPGDSVQFHPISKEEFLQYGGSLSHDALS